MSCIVNGKISIFNSIKLKITVKLYLPVIEGLFLSFAGPYSSCKTWTFQGHNKAMMCYGRIFYVLAYILTKCISLVIR